MSTQEKKELRGLNIYNDKKGRTVYYDWFTKNGYVIPPNKYDNYTNYSIRFVVSVLVGFLSALFLKDNYLAGIAIGASTYIAYTFVFRRRFLNSLTIIPDFKRPIKENYIDRNVVAMPKKRVISIILIAFFLVFAIAANAIIGGYDIVMLILNLGLSAAALGFLVVHVIILVKKKQKGIDF